MQTGLTPRSLELFTGLQNYEEANSVPGDKIYSAQNCRFDKYTLTSKPGYQSLGTALTGGTKFTALIEYPYFASGVTTKRLIGMYNKGFYQFNSATQVWDSISTTWSDVADLETQGIVYNNKLYFINPMDDTQSTVVYAPAYLTGGTGATNVPGTWAQVTNGSFVITINGSVRTVTGLDFTGVLTMDDVANVVQSGIRAQTGSTETVRWVGTYFIISSINTTSSSAITVTSTGGGGTDISGGGAVQYLDANSGSGTVTAAAPKWPGVGKIDNATFSVVSNSPRGTAIESWVERLWVIGDHDAPNAVLASRPASAANPTYIEDWITSPILELIGKGGKNTAIRVLNNELFIWKEDSIWYNTTDRVAAEQTSFIELSRTGGAINQKSTIVVENDVWFLSQTAQGVEVRSLGLERNLGNSPRTRELTSIIKTTMRTLNVVQDNPVMSYKDRLVKISLKSLNSPTNNVQITYDYNTGAYSVDVGQAVDLSVVWNNQLVYSEDSSAGQTYLDEFGYTANGAAYVFDVKTPMMDQVFVKKHYVSRPDIEKRARYIYIKGKQSYNQAVTIRLYRGDYTTYSEYTIPSPADRGVTVSSSVDDGQYGSQEQGAAEFGGTWEGTNDITMYPIKGLSAEDGYLISVDRRSTAFAAGVNAQINGGKVEIEMINLKTIEDNENYKRSNL